MAFKGNKKLVAGVIIGVLFAGVGTTYAAPNVDFVNYKFKFDGTEKTVPSGYSVLEYQNHSYVPVRYVAEQLGAKVTWDEANKTVDITSNGQLTNAITTLKTYSEVADNYRRLGTLGDIIHNSYNEFQTAVDYFNQFNDNSRITSAIDDFNNLVVPAFNTSLDNLKSSLAKETQAGINSNDLSDYNAVMSSYSNAIDDFKNAITYLVNYSNDKTLQSEKAFLDNLQTGDQTRINASNVAATDYNKMYLKIQNYGN